MFSEMLVYKNTVYEFAYKVTSTTTTTLVTKKKIQPNYTSFYWSSKTLS